MCGSEAVPTIRHSTSAMKLRRFLSVSAWSSALAAAISASVALGLSFRSFFSAPLPEKAVA